MLLFLISFIAGVLTAIAPCVLPLLPVIVGGSLAGGSNRRAITISASLGVSVVLFTLLLKASTAFINVPESFWQWFSAVILIAFGIVMVFPSLWDRLGFVNLMNRSGNKLLATGYQKNSLWGDALMGAALGPVFSSCSPTYFVILATVLPASFLAGFADLLAYAIGLSGFLLIIALVGQKLVDKLGVAIEPGGWFRRTIGIIFIIVGLAVGTGVEANLEAYLLNNGFDLTFIEQRLLGAPSGNGVQMPLATGGAVNATSTPPLTPAEKSGTFQKSPELTGIDGYINTGGQPITISQFKGKKVVLIDFWTYSCINCQREIPYINLWQQKYADQGLEIIGVSTPEFAFEHVLSNVQNAVNQLGIKYPVVLDNEYGTWNAFGNEFWPRVYLVDIDGYIVYNHAGEGDYDTTELAIQKALAERDTRLGLAAPSESAPAAPSGAVEVDESQLGSPETYFGAARNQYLGNGTQGQAGDQTLTLPQNPNVNTLYLGGAWNFSQEYATNDASGAKIEFLYKAKNVYFVAASGTGQPIKLKITRDGGQPLGASAGADVDANGIATISEDRLYQLLGDSAYGVHTLEIQVESPGLQAYTFTFG
jgi:cytochrome c biogenesis protein CcdA/thiol-disulfide isomerase/thioredoxin